MGERALGIVVRAIEVEILPIAGVERLKMFGGLGGPVLSFNPPSFAQPVTEF